MFEGHERFFDLLASQARGDRCLGDVGEKVERRRPVLCYLFGRCHLFFDVTTGIYSLAGASNTMLVVVARR